MTTMLTLHSNGNRLVQITTSDAEKLVAEWQEQCLAAPGDDHLIALDLSCRVWRRDCLDVLEPFLRSIVNRVHTIKIDDIIAGLVTEDGLASLAFFNTVFCENASSLTVLNLDDNALGIRGVELLRDLMALPKTLTLENTGLSRESLVVLNVREDIEAICLGRNQIGPEGAEVVGERLPKWQNLSVLKYNGCRPLEQGTRAICRGLAENTISNSGLKEINLMDSEIKSGDDDEHPIHDFCAAIERSPQLTSLNVVDCSLQKEGLELLIRALSKSNTKLTCMKLSGNELEIEGTETLSKYLLEHQTETLECLEVGTNEFENEGLEHLLPFFQKAGKLRELNISENLLEPEAVETILRNKIPSLQKLVITETEMTRKQAKQLRALYSDVEVDDDEDLLDGDDEDDDDEEDAADDEEVGDLAALMNKTGL